jgi:transketolase
VSHQTTDDVGAMRILPNVAIVEPSDAIQADLLFEKILEYEGPVYLRTFRSATELIYAEGNAHGVRPIRQFELGKGYKIKDGKDIALICSGPILAQALTVANRVKESICVVDIPTIRPIDSALIEEVARKIGRICTVQDHYENGGLNDEVLRVIAARRLNVRFEYIALSCFARSGTPEDIYEAYGLSADAMIQKLGLTLKG